MPTAINLRNNAAKQEQVTRTARRKQRRQQLRQRTFEELTPGQRQLLLKEVAIRLGMIADSDDG